MLGICELGKMPVQTHLDPTAMALLDLAAQLAKYRFDGLGRNIGADGVSEQGMRGFAVLVIDGTLLFFRRKYPCRLFRN